MNPRNSPDQHSHGKPTLKIPLVIITPFRLGYLAIMRRLRDLEKIKERHRAQLGLLLLFPLLLLPLLVNHNDVVHSSQWTSHVVGRQFSSVTQSHVGGKWEHGGSRTSFSDRLIQTGRSPLLLMYHQGSIQAESQFASRTKLCTHPVPRVCAIPPVHFRSIVDLEVRSHLAPSEKQANTPLCNYEPSTRSTCNVGESY